MLYPSSVIQKTNKVVKYQETMKGRVVHFVLHKEVGEQLLPDFGVVTSVAVLPFIDEHTIVAAQLERGIDIPGGHVEQFDVDATATVVREAQEEAGIELAQPIYLLGIIESDYKDEPTYMLVMTTRVAKLNPYVPQLESLGREQVALDVFLRRYTANSGEMMKELCKRAKALSHELFPRVA